MDANTPDLLAAGDDESLVLARYAEQAYLDYAVSVVRGRARPEVSDGHKPVQRRNQ
jgi:topoisomerase-4 subunit A